MDGTLRPASQIRQCTLLTGMTFNNEDITKIIRNNLETAFKMGLLKASYFFHLEQSKPFT